MTSAIASQGKIRELLLLRTIVSILGERVTPLWWRTQFLTDVGLRALARVFPRTAASAALNSVLIVARGDHDKRIGVGGRYHLFRLPANMEHAVTLLTSEATFAVETAAKVSRGREDLIHELATIARGRKENRTEGPVRLGSSVSIAEAVGVERLAAHYEHSFHAGRRAFPYFEDLEGRH